jgi:hypothetical protein
LSTGYNKMLVLSVGYEAENFDCRTLEINRRQYTTDNDFLFSVLQAKTFYSVSDK